MLVEALLALPAALLSLGWAYATAKKSRHPLMLQWGRFSNSRPGIKGHKIWSDEPDVVSYEDFKYWLRFSPNPGINLPLIGYWSKARGRRR
jgi:hypothetical protein